MICLPTKCERSMKKFTAAEL